MQYPHNVEAEQALLGALMMNNAFYEKIEGKLNSRHFYDPIHQRIFAIIESHNERGLATTPIILKSALKDDKDPQDIEDYLAAMAEMATTIINVEQLARLIYELALRRELMQIGEDIYNGASKEIEEYTINDRIEAAEQKIFNLATSSFSERSFSSLADLTAVSLKNIEAAYSNKSNLIGITTGFIDLDRLLGGFQKSDLLIVAGRPAMGKSAFAINLAVNACKHLDSGKSVGVFSLEMSSEQIATRMLAMESGINSNKLRMGTVHEDEFEQVVKASRILNELDFYVDDTPAISISSLRTRTRKLCRQNNMAILFVDYLQLVRGVARSSESSRVNEVSEITQGLKAIAKELNIPVIALSQLSRAVELRDDKRPQLADLRESGSIEQDADVVMFIYREEYYERRKQPPEGTEQHGRWQIKMEQIRNQSEIIVAKQRNGPVGSAKLFFDYNTTVFRNYTDEYNID
jgi:replicative DNA helicase